MASGGVIMSSSAGTVDRVLPTPPALATAAEKPKLSTVSSSSSTGVSGGGFFSRGGGGGVSGTPVVGIGHTIHPKLSLSAKRSVGSSGASSAAAGGLAEMTVDNGGHSPVGGSGTTQSNNGNHFKLSIRISDAENGTPIMFKQDGSRFATSQRTLKLHSNCKYRIALQCKPPQDFLSLHIGGSDLELVSERGGPCSSVEYTAMWNTTGIDPSRKGIRQDIHFVLSGPGKTLDRKLQTKFYAREDNHAGMGHRVEAICWTCESDPTGQVQVVDEKLL